MFHALFLKKSVHGNKPQPYKIFSSFSDIKFYDIRKTKNTFHKNTIKLYSYKKIFPYLTALKKGKVFLKFQDAMVGFLPIQNFKRFALP